MRTLLLATAVLVMTLPGSGWAQPADYVSTKKVAQELNLERLVLPGGDSERPTMVLLKGRGHNVTIVSRVDYVTVDRKTLPLDKPVVAAEGDLHVPGGILGPLAEVLGVTLKDKADEEPKPPERRVTRRRGGLVVIDPGHGGKDSGAIGSVMKLYEKNIVLDVAKRVAQALRKRGVDVEMTRSTDVFIELDDRVAFANRIGPDLFVSIHADAAGPSAEGSTAFFGDDDLHGGKADITYRALLHKKSLKPPLEKIGAEGRLSDTVQTAVFGALMQEYRARSWKAGEFILESLTRAGGTRPRGTREENFRVIRYPACPSVLIELDFVTNREAERRLSQPAYRERLAKGIADGVSAYLKDSGVQSGDDEW